MLKKEFTAAERKTNGKKGGVKSGVVRRARKTLKQELELLLSCGGRQKAISVALLEKALAGDIKAYEVIRDTIGEKQAEKNDSTVTHQIEGVSKLSKLIDEAIRLGSHKDDCRTGKE